ncbi:succinate dehydrogenase, hydrophobic membrane anchor protein [Palleronia caenipelagi]|uniref:Succinate dehydrogenase hydrophobic membrane anchor subunit n=1 Tax=Palleronia caenipelagi TaxID=2489174 RepID=A0A547QAT8_9RHOB|nr:succinate dehydrogenase, hydrophobic membrane anchor protein [Palleronia caenipelagi]TRD23498.1 succinate dehydrogenase, hydrophobic membrane anchor protein [Palleronia caenipelagi]
MSYLTARKRASGLGSAKSGTEHYWSQTISAVALLFLVPSFIFTFGSVLGSSYEEVVAYYSRPYPAIIALLTLTVGWLHFKNGAQVMLEDYVRGMPLKIAVIVLNCISYAALAAGALGILRIAL